MPLFLNRKILSINFLGLLSAFWFCLNLNSCKKAGAKMEVDKMIGLKSAETFKVQLGGIVARVTASGKLVPKARAIISAPYDGFVQKMYVEVGQKVKYLDPLLSINSSIDKTANGEFPLRSPLNGIVVQIYKQQGEPVEKSSESKLLMIDDLSEYFIQASVPEAQISDVKKGMAAKIRFQAFLDQEFSGKLIEVSYAEGQNGQGGFFGGGDQGAQYPIKIKLEKPNDRLKSGMGCLIDIIITDKKNILVLPHEYVWRDKEKFFVNFVNGEKREISVGLSDENNFEIVKGLSAGDEVKLVDFLSLSDDL